MEIHKRNVRNSIWVTILSGFILLVIGMMINVTTGSHPYDYMAVLIVPFGLMIIGIIVWFPALLICLLLEHFAINEHTKVAGLFSVLILEALVPVIVFQLILGEVVNEITSIYLLITLLAQAMRWIYLSRKKRMFVQSNSQ